MERRESVCAALSPVHGCTIGIHGNFQPSGESDIQYCVGMAAQRGPGGPALSSLSLQLHNSQVLSAEMKVQSQEVSNVWATCNWTDDSGASFIL